MPRNDHADLPVPDLADPLFAPFWKGTANGQLWIQHCADCGKAYWPPRYCCAACSGFHMAWKQCPTRGRLYSWTTVGKATAKGFPDVPYVVGLVTLDEQPAVRIAGNVVGVAPDALKTDMPLEAHFVPAGPQGELHIVAWRPLAVALPAT